MIERPQIIITPKGTSGFSCVEEARSFENMTVKAGDKPAPRSYSQVLILDRKEGEAFVESLKKPIELLRDKEIEKRKAAGKVQGFQQSPTLRIRTYLVRIKYLSALSAIIAYLSISDHPTNS